MRKEVLLGVVAISILLGISVVAFPDGAAALLVILILSITALIVFRHYAVDKEFVTNVFLAGLVLRLGFGVAVHMFDLRGFFGGDAATYDFRGFLLMQSWIGGGSMADDATLIAQARSGPGWGMDYLVGFLYMMIGRNIFAAQSLCGVVGAATSPMVYFCANRIYANQKVARTSAIIVAVFPAFVIWSGQLLKDGLIVFLLVLAITMLLQLQEKFDPIALTLLFLSLAGILTLRFYIFYMVAVAVAGSFIVGISSSSGSLMRRTVALVFLGLAVTYFGVVRNATESVENYDLAKLQNSRLDLRQSAKSGYGEDIDVSTTQGAITAIPIGFLYLMFAPFPWEAASLRQAITLPEVLIWWGMIPLMIYGLWWTIKNKLRNALPILIFTLMLTLAYSIFQGNVGTAYRQRTQIQVFLFIFISIGLQLYREKKEDKKLVRKARQQGVVRRLQADMQQ
jgi:4-amino-4-deoxy-L-arabinose transferase-like glycosyltransferase